MRSGVILAGGKSSRMGIDKCTILFCGKPLIFWSYSNIKELVDEIILSVSKDKDTEPLIRLLGEDILFAEDEKPNIGPLSGLYSSIKKAKGDYIAVIPCDSPLVKIELYNRLFEIAKGSEGAVPKVGGYYEPLHGVYKRDAMLKAIEKVFEEGRKRPKDTYEYLDIIELTEEEIKTFDPDLHSFFNINSFADLASASGIFIRTRKNSK
jgi:molybdopterin-guanine dinucleotide biosynthesis protein A